MIHLSFFLFLFLFFFFAVDRPLFVQLVADTPTTVATLPLHWTVRQAKTQIANLDASHFR